MISIELTGNELYNFAIFESISDSTFFSSGQTPFAFFRAYFLSHVLNESTSAIRHFNFSESCEQHRKTSALKIMPT
jgi:hypothetical protein